jgi:hypothetical protein
MGFEPWDEARERFDALDERDVFRFFGVLCE